uniref:WH2 domain-containing protein n=1 Tax=Macrostomum lignano TaxID=282301 RepID=A0A1I8IHS4_9PLAT
VAERIDELLKAKDTRYQLREEPSIQEFVRDINPMRDLELEEQRAGAQGRRRRLAEAIGAPGGSLLRRSAPPTVNGGGSGGGVGGGGKSAKKSSAGGGGGARLTSAPFIQSSSRPTSPLRDAQQQPPTPHQIVHSGKSSAGGSSGLTSPNGPIAQSPNHSRSISDPVPAAVGAAVVSGGGSGSPAAAPAAGGGGVLASHSNSNSGSSQLPPLPPRQTAGLKSAAAAVKSAAVATATATAAAASTSTGAAPPLPPRARKSAPPPSLPPRTSLRSSSVIVDDAFDPTAALPGHLALLKAESGSQESTAWNSSAPPFGQRVSGGQFPRMKIKESEHRFTIQAKRSQDEGLCVTEISRLDAIQWNRTPKGSGRLHASVQPKLARLTRGRDLQDETAALHRVEDLCLNMAAAPQGVRHALQRSRSRCSSTGGGPGGRQLDALVEADESGPQQPPPPPPPPLPPTATAQQPRRQHRRRRQSIFSLSRLRRLLSLRPAPLPLPPPQPPQPPKPQRAHLAAVPAKCLGAVPLSSARLLLAAASNTAAEFVQQPVEQLVAAAAAARRRQRNSLASTATTAEGSSVLPVAMVTVSVGGLTVQPLEQEDPSLTRLTPTGLLAAAPDSRASSADTQRHPIESVVCASVHRRLPRIFCCAIVDSDATAACHAFLCARTDSADCLVQAVARVHLHRVAVPVPAAAAGPTANSGIFVSAHAGDGRPAASVTADASAADSASASAASASASAADGAAAAPSGLAGADDEGQGAPELAIEPGVDDRIVPDVAHGHPVADRVSQDFRVTLADRPPVARNDIQHHDGLLACHDAHAVCGAVISRRLAVLVAGAAQDGLGNPQGVDDAGVDEHNESQGQHVLSEEADAAQAQPDDGLVERHEGADCAVREQHPAVEQAQQHGSHPASCNHQLDCSLGESRFQRRHDDAVAINGDAHQGEAADADAQAVGKIGHCADSVAQVPVVKEDKQLQQVDGDGHAGQDDLRHRQVQQENVCHGAQAAAPVEHAADQRIANKRRDRHDNYHHGDDIQQRA